MNHFTDNADMPDLMLVVHDWQLRRHLTQLLPAHAVVEPRESVMGVRVRGIVFVDDPPAWRMESEVERAVYVEWVNHLRCRLVPGCENGMVNVPDWVPRG